ncbi:MAG: RNA-dependent DNA polymerase [Chloroflexi bacterium AL-N10]|nr:RNA-dependent DNA polymerase [Chloroflexi bacterium AL-N10]
MAVFPRYHGPPLLEQICRVDNLTLAWRRVRRNIQVARRGRSAGTDAMTLRDFEADWTHQMTQLAEALQHGTYRPLPAKQVTIPKRSGGERAIAILSVRDRIAQRAVQQVLEPLFDPLLLDCAYECRPRVGVPDAIARVERYAAQGLTWVVDADIANYFDQINHRVLLGLLRQRIAESALLHLLAQWLTAGVLTAEEEAPLAETPPNLWHTGKATIQRVLQSPSAAGIPAPHDLDDPLLADPSVAGMPQAGGNWEQRIWMAATLARPALQGLQAALPYVQRVGRRRMLWAGAAAVSAVAAGEVALRLRHQGGRGTLQGSPLSPLLANIYLHPFDVALTTQGLPLVRFMDDLVVLCATRDEAEQSLRLVERQLAAVRLRLNTEKTQIVDYADGLDFLGHALVPRRTDGSPERGLRSFREAETALRSAAARIRKQKR